jgi:hypothetical protein
MYDLVACRIIQAFFNEIKTVYPDEYKYFLSSVPVKLL